MSTFFQIQFRDTFESFSLAKKWSAWDGLPALEEVLYNHSATICERDYLFIQSLLDSLPCHHIIELDLMIRNPQSRLIFHMAFNWKRDQPSTIQRLIHTSNAFLPLPVREYCGFYYSLHGNSIVMYVMQQSFNYLLSPYTVDNNDNDNDDDVVIDNIRAQEQRLVALHRPLPPRPENNEDYFKLLTTEVERFQDTLSFVPRYYVADNEHRNILCVICQTYIVIGDHLSCFKCNHFLHAHCLMKHIESSYDGNKSCPHCRNDNIQLIAHLEDDDDDD